jgi:hypothetical protein
MLPSAMADLNIVDGVTRETGSLDIAWSARSASILPDSPRSLVFTAAHVANCIPTPAALRSALFRFNAYLIFFRYVEETFEVVQDRQRRS